MSRCKCHISVFNFLHDIKVLHEDFILMVWMLYLLSGGPRLQHPIYIVQVEVAVQFHTMAQTQVAVMSRLDLGL